MKKVYRILHYDLVGVNLYSYELQGEFKEENIKVEDGEIKAIYPNGDRRVDAVIKPSYVRDISFIPKGVHIRDTKYFPYFANVTEDLPASMNHLKIVPRVWKNCQLMTEKHGTYLQFYHKKTDTVLRIAINSNYYEPIK